MEGINDEFNQQSNVDAVSLTESFLLFNNFYYENWVILSTQYLEWVYAFIYTRATTRNQITWSIIQL